VLLSFPIHFGSRAKRNSYPNWGKNFPLKIPDPSLLQNKEEAGNLNK